MVLFQHLTNGEKVAQTLGHFLAINAHRTGVHPGCSVLLAGGCFALGDLVLVVREYQIRATAMDIEGVTQAAGGHNRALDMPARATFTPGRRPARLTRLGGFPQHKIQRVLLGFVHLDARADFQIFDLATG